MTPIDFNEDYILYFFNIPYIGPICTYCYNPCYNVCNVCLNYTCEKCHSCCLKLKFKEKNFLSSKKNSAFTTRIPTLEFSRLHKNKQEDRMRIRFEEYKREGFFKSSTLLIRKINELKYFKNALLDYRNTLYRRGPVTCFACKCHVDLLASHKRCLICKSYFHKRCVLMDEAESFRCVRCMFYKCDFCDRSDDQMRGEYVHIKDEEISIKKRRKGYSPQLFFTNSSPVMIGHSECIISNGYEVLQMKPKPVLQNNTVLSFNYKYMIRFILTALNRSVSVDYIAQYVDLYCLARDEYFTRVAEMGSNSMNRIFTPTFSCKRIFNVVKFNLNRKTYMCTVDRIGIIYSDRPGMTRNVQKMHSLSCFSYKPGCDVPRTYIKNRVNLQISSIEGMGLFATDFFMKDQIICIYRGIRLKKGESDRMENYYKRNNFNSIYLSKFKFSGVLYVEDETIYGTYSKYINHSCMPNCYTSYTYDKENVDIGIYAMKNILPGEELTYNYELSGGEKIPCLCGHQNCKKYL